MGRKMKMASRQLLSPLCNVMSVQRPLLRDRCLPRLTSRVLQNAAFAAALSSGTVTNSSGRLETLVVPGANHLAMTNGPWDSTTMVDGYAGALAWLITQRRAQPGKQRGSISFIALWPCL